MISLVFINVLETESNWGSATHCSSILDDDFFSQQKTAIRPFLLFALCHITILRLLFRKSTLVGLEHHSFTGCLYVFDSDRKKGKIRKIMLLRSFPTIHVLAAIFTKSNRWGRHDVASYDFVCLYLRHIPRPLVLSLTSCYVSSCSELHKYCMLQA